MAGAARLKFKLGKRDLWSPYLLTPSVLRGWWSARDHGTALMTDDGAGLISSWGSRVSDGPALTAATTARPTWGATSFNSAYPGLTFDGSANCFVTTTLTNLPTGTNSGFICGVVNQPVGSGTAGTLNVCGYGATTANAGRLVRRVVNASENRLRILDNTTSLTDTSTPFSGNCLVIGAWSSGAELSRINGAASTPPSAATAFNTGTSRLRVGADVQIAASSFYNGVISEVLIGTDTSTATLQLLEGYLAWQYWANAASNPLPSTHPYKFLPP